MANKNTNTLKNINSFLIAIILTAEFIARMIAAIGGVEENVKPALSIIALFISYMIVMMTKSKVKFEKNSMVFIYFIFLTFLISFLFRGIESYTSSYFFFFILYGLIPFLLTRSEYSPTKVIYFTLLIGNIVLINPIAFRDYIRVGETYNYVSMDATYAILPSIIATIIYIFYIKNIGNILIYVVSLISNAFLLYIVMFEGSRGAFLAIIILFIVMFGIYISSKVKVNFGLGFIYSFLSALLVIILTFAIVNINKILFWLDNLLLSYDIEIAALTKTMNTIERNGILGILNGRDLVYERGYELFEQSPIFGHGIGVYADIYNGDYPHNLFLQLLVEGGMIFAFPFIILFVVMIWYLIKPWTKRDEIYEIRLYILFLFTICIPRLMFSSYFWREGAFWLLTFVIFSVVANHKERARSTHLIKYESKDRITDNVFSKPVHTRS